MAYGIYGIEGKGEEGQNKKYLAKKKMERRKSKLQALKAHTRKDRGNFFLDFVIL